MIMCRILCSLKERLQNRDVDHITVVIDNCCSWKKKLAETFAPMGIDVKLDLYYAVACITNTLPKSIECRKEMMHEISQLFRRQGDTGSVRMQETAASADILHNVETFMNKWGSANHPLLPQETVDALKRLKLHISKECLSAIPVGYGTNRNERLHRLLNNSALHVSRIGPESANAILDTILYR